jgi:hypothetical protein
VVGLKLRSFYSALKVAGITDVHHHIWLMFICFKNFSCWGNGSSASKFKAMRSQDCQNNNNNNKTPSPAMISVVKVLIAPWFSGQMPTSSHSVIDSNF